MLTIDECSADGKERQGRPEEKRAWLTGVAPASFVEVTATQPASTLPRTHAAGSNHKGQRQQRRRKRQSNDWWTGPMEKYQEQ